MATPVAAADYLVYAYQHYLFQNKSLQDLPDKPRFIINATDLAHATLWRFTKNYMGGYYAVIRQPDILVATAVAASSAFPPFLSPIELQITSHIIERPPAMGDPIEATGKDVQYAFLTDGGVMDNRGTPPIIKRYRTILVSDGGAGMLRADQIETDWLHQIQRVVDIIGNQYAAIDKRNLIDLFQVADRLGALWYISADLSDYGLPDAMACPYEKTRRLATIPTRLAYIDDNTQEKLINWGYIVADAALRRHVLPSASPGSLPYPASPCE